MSRVLMTTLSLFAVLLLTTGVSLAGSPHFVECSQETVGNTVSIEGKIAGLGSESQVHIEVTATAACINPGSHHPKAANKESVSAEGTFPVQNGRALFSLGIEATFSPSCSPPMSVEFTDISACDTEHEVCCTL